MSEPEKGEATIHFLRGETEALFSNLIRLSRLSQERLASRVEEWTILELLEHISLVNRYILLLLIKIQRIALKRAAKGESFALADVQITLLEGPVQDLRWEAPEHMRPTGEAPASELRLLFTTQMKELLSLLESLSRGEGTLHTIRLSVNETGKIDFYNWMWFLLLHARRHLRLLARKYPDLAESDRRA